MTAPTTPELDDLDALVQDLRDYGDEWSWDETRQRISRFVAQRAGPSRTRPEPPTPEALAFVDSWEWKWVREKRLESAAALDRFAAEAVDRARPTLGDTAIRHAGTVHSHSGPCKPDCAATPPPGDAEERDFAKDFVDRAEEAIALMKADKPGDAGERARRLVNDSGPLHSPSPWHIVGNLDAAAQAIAAALQSERAAAASQARKAAIEECARACRGPGNAVDAEQRIRALATPQESVE